jgi:cell wall-associated NlpC family hydrolase
VASRGYLRSVVGALSATALAVATCVVLTGPAYADPPAPPNTSDAVKQLDAAQHDAEALTEQWHAAQDQLDARQDEAARARAAIGPAQRALARARATEDAFRAKIDQVATEALQGGALDSLNALVLSDSPSDFLDQMTTLETFSADQKSVLEHAEQLVAASRQAQADATAAQQQAELAAVQARDAFREIDVRKVAAKHRIDQAEALLARLSPAQKAVRTEGVDGPVGMVLGGSRGALALKAALTRFDSPYVWGATGPRSFDCSGLVYWAFQKVGITMPRSSAAQSEVGTPVSRDDLRPGDLIFFYSPVSHVGFYVGNGKVLNAVQTGDVVRYSDLSRMKYHSARRL